jgi:hypothetical protein
VEIILYENCILFYGLVEIKNMCKFVEKIYENTKSEFQCTGGCTLRVGLQRCPQPTNIQGLFKKFPK